MQTSLPTHYGFLIRRYECDADLMDYAQIDAPICESVDEVLDEVVEYLKNYLGEVYEKPLSARAWKSVRKKMRQSANSGDWKISPSAYPEFGGRIVPISIKVDSIPLSPRLVRMVQGREDAADTASTGLVGCELCKKSLSKDESNLVLCDFIGDEAKEKKIMHVCDSCLDDDLLDAKIRTCPQCEAFVDSFVVRNKGKCPECGFVERDVLTWI